MLPRVLLASEHGYQLTWVALRPELQWRICRLRVYTTLHFDVRTSPKRGSKPTKSHRNALVGHLNCGERHWNVVLTRKQRSASRWWATDAKS